MRGSRNLEAAGSSGRHLQTGMIWIEKCQDLLHPEQVSHIMKMFVYDQEVKLNRFWVDSNDS